MGRRRGFVKGADERRSMRHTGAEPEEPGEPASRQSPPGPNFSDAR
jgi:hypothetical protein